MVLIILDCNRGLETEYNIINNIIISILNENAGERLIVAHNKCNLPIVEEPFDFDYDKSEPNPALIKRLDDFAFSIKERIQEGTRTATKDGKGITIDPIYYSSGFTTRKGEKYRSYNLVKLLCRIIERIPKEKRMVIVEQITDDPNVIGGDSKNFWESVNDDSFEIIENIGDFLDFLKNICDRHLHIFGVYEKKENTDNL